jgi:nucleoside-diphosphate-sugar epimerase
MRADLAIAKKILNFSPKYNLEQGLLKTIENDIRFQKKERVLKKSDF